MVCEVLNKTSFAMLGPPLLREQGNHKQTTNVSTRALVQAATLLALDLGVALDCSLAHPPLYTKVALHTVSSIATSRRSPRNSVR